MRFSLIGPVYPYRGGIAHYTTMLSDAFRERGHQLLLVSFRRQYPKWLFPGGSDEDPSTRPLEAVDARYWIDSLNPLTWMTSFLRIRNYGPEAIILQWWTTFWSPVWTVLGLLNSLVLRRPLIYVCHNVLPHERSWGDKHLTRWALRWGDRFVVQSSQERERLLGLLPQARVDIVPQPVYDMFSHRCLPKEEARNILGLAAGVPVLLFFGIVREYKGLRDLLEALPVIEANLGETKLIVAGEFWEGKRRYMDAVDRLGIGSSVLVEDRYIPNEEVPIYFSAADVLVAPYREVTGSGAVQLALGCGCPVITTDVSNLGESIQEGVNGLIALPADSEDLAKTVIRYFDEGMQHLPREAVGRDKGTSGWDELVKLAEDASTTCESPSS